ncbi:hypothetical protein VTN00DRAFT_4208 [Thermoascus crustaceus]|uniref:uncharacterized protein n=1 Tax=Thermoascus crustaceus TaxID=5088 RepID=UPI00374410F7
MCHDKQPTRESFRLFSLHPSVHLKSSAVLSSDRPLEALSKSTELHLPALFLFFDYRNQRLLYYTPACCMYILNYDGSNFSSRNQSPFG